MKEKIKQLHIYYQISILCSALTVSFAVISLFCLIWNLWTISLGIFLGGALGSTSIFFLGMSEKASTEKKKIILSIVNLFVRYVVLVGLVVLVILLKSKKDITIFNPIAFLCMYLVTSTVFIICLKIKEKGEKDV